jgi:hypothetical protein
VAKWMATISKFGILKTPIPSENMSVIAQSSMCGAVPLALWLFIENSASGGCLAWCFQAICGPTIRGNLT